MSKKEYVLLLLEDTNLVKDEKIELGYWDGKSYKADDSYFPGVLIRPNDERVKVYKTYKGAEKAVSKLGDKFPYISTARIEER